MSVPAIVNQATSSLPQLVDHAAAALANARTAAEVLEAKDIASFAYDTAKSTARLAKVKNAHDELIAAAHRAQADALAIEAQAKRRLADEYDQARINGTASAQGQRTDLLPDEKKVATVAELGLTHKELHDARLLRDAEEADPGIVRRTLDEKLARGEEPTRSAVRRAAEARLQRSVDRLKRIQESVRRLEAEEAAIDLIRTETLEKAAALTDAQAQVFRDEAHDLKIWGDSAMSKRALAIAEYFAKHATAIRALKGDNNGR